jgi:hypothetical protein
MFLFYFTTSSIRLNLMDVVELNTIKLYWLHSDAKRST